MKKIILILLLVLFIVQGPSFIVHCLAAEVTVNISNPVSLDATNWIHIPISGTGAVMLQCRSSVDVYIASSFTPGSAYWTIRSGTAVTMGIRTAGDAGLYGKAASGPVSLEIIYLSE